MAISYITGFEFGAPGEFNNESNSVYSTTHKRNGAYGILFTNSSQASQDLLTSGGIYTTSFLSASFYLKIVTMLNGTSTIYTTINQIPTQFDRLRLNSTGTLTVTDGTNSATSTNALSADGQFHRIDFDCGWSSGSGRQVYVDGVLWASTAVGSSVKQGSFAFGIVDGGITGALAFDDMVVDDSSFTSSGFPGDRNITLLLPVSDGTLGNWTAGAGATTSLFDAVNNIPAVGKANASATDTSQIKNPTSSANNDVLLNCQTYTAGGISGTVKAVMAIGNMGSSSATTTAGAITISSNPAQSAPGQTFDYPGISGVYPSNWKSKWGVVATLPTVTLGSNPVVTIRKTTATTRVTFADLLGVYVAWSPATRVFRKTLSPLGTRVGTRQAL